MSEQDATQEAEASEVEVDDASTEPQEGAEDDLAEVDRDEALAWSPDEARRKIAKINNEIRATKRKLQEAQGAPKADPATQARLGELETVNLRYEIALDLGLPKEIASRLQGADRDEMVADAEKLLELLSPAKRPTSRKPTEALRGGLEPDKEPEETDLSKLGARMFQR